MALDPFVTPYDVSGNINTEPLAQALATYGASVAQQAAAALGGLDLSKAVQSADYTLLVADFAPGNKVVRVNPTAGQGLRVEMPALAGLADGASMVTVQNVGDGEVFLWPPGGDQTLIKSPRGHRAVVTPGASLVLWRESGTVYRLDGGSGHYHFLDTFTGGTVGNNLTAGVGHRADIGHPGGATLFAWALTAFTGNGGRFEFSATTGQVKGAGTTHSLMYAKLAPPIHNQRHRLGLIRVSSPVTNSYRPGVGALATEDTGFFAYLNEATSVWTLEQRTAGSASSLATYPVDGTFPTPALGLYFVEVEKYLQPNGKLTVNAYVDYNAGLGPQRVLQAKDVTVPAAGIGLIGIRGILAAATLELTSSEAWCFDAPKADPSRLALT